MSYIRVVPRDLFNEADLLKMLGKLVIAVMDRKKPVRDWNYEYDHAPFDIEQSQDDGSISCTNLKFFVGEEEVHLFRPLNARQSWQLYALIEGVVYSVFDEDGKVVLEEAE